MMASRPHFRTIQIIPKDLSGILREDMTRMDNAAHLLTAWTAHVPGEDESANKRRGEWRCDGAISS